MVQHVVCGMYHHSTRQPLLTVKWCQSRTVSSAPCCGALASKRLGGWHRLWQPLPSLNTAGTRHVRLSVVGSFSNPQSHSEQMAGAKLVHLRRWPKTSCQGETAMRANATLQLCSAVHWKRLFGGGQKNTCWRKGECQAYVILTLCMWSCTQECHMTDGLQMVRVT